MSEKTITSIMRHTLRGLIYDEQNEFSGSLKNKNPHAGLLLQRGLLQWDKDDKEAKEGKKKSAKAKIIDEVSSMTSSPLYEKAFKRWAGEITANEKRFAFLAAKIVGRLYTGLGVGTALETHLTTHHTYGMPMLAGSGVKGVVAAYAEKIGLPENVRAILFGNDKDETTAGAVVWHDAWWMPNMREIPDDEKSSIIPPFVGEIVTTHHQKYYNGTEPKATETESPVPNQQIACQGYFYFVAECDSPEWAKFAMQLLFETLQNQGIGSKTASGYGYFHPDKDDENDEKSINNIAKQRISTIRKKMKGSRIDKTDLASVLAALTETELYENLSRNKTRFFTEIQRNKDSQKDREELVKLILANETLSDYVNSWASEKDNNKEKAFKFIQNNTPTES